MNDLRTSAPGGSTAPRPTGQTETLIRVAQAILAIAPAEVGAAVGPRRVHRLVRQYEKNVSHNGWKFVEFFSNALSLDTATRHRVLADDEVCRLTYRDTTGESAVINVRRERGY